MWCHYNSYSLKTRGSCFEFFQIMYGEKYNVKIIDFFKINFKCKYGA
jgi:hypothetical protein